MSVAELPHAGGLGVHLLIFNRFRPSTRKRWNDVEMPIVLTEHAHLPVKWVLKKTSSAITCVPFL